MIPEKVLLVDDDPDFVNALSERMAHRGIKVDTAASGNDALEKEGKASYDAIILDLLMPKMDGIETLKQLLARNPDLQVILLTGHASLQKGIEAMKLGASDFLEKPADIEALTEKIRQAKARRMLLVEKKTEQKIRDILEDKGW